MYTQITENLFGIYVGMSYSPLRNLNAYLIKGGQRCLLIDAGDHTEESRRDLFTGLEELRVRREDMDIFLTHLHTDHCGLVPELYVPGMRVFMSGTDIRYKSELLSRADPSRMTANRLRMGFPEREAEASTVDGRRQYYFDDFAGFTPISDGQVLEYGGRRLRAIATPGHTPGHLCLYEEKAGVLFCGDHVLFTITPNIAYWGESFDSLGSYVQSLTRVRDLSVSTLLPAHRQVTGTLPERVDEIIEHHGRRVLETADLLDARPGVSAYELAGHMHWNISYDGNWSNFPLGQKFFAVSEILAHLEYLVNRDRAKKITVEGVNRYYPLP